MLEAPCRPSTRAHVAEVLHCQKVDIEETVDAVGQALLLPTLQLGVSDGPRHAFFPAHLGQRMGFCRGRIVSRRAKAAGEYGD
jgi:hypothetical protein